MTMAKKIKNYQRLTHYNENTRKAVVYDYISMSPEWSPIVNRLAAFEDAIERGEILLKEEAEKLKSENAALRERLENAVELKAKVGDVIYMPWEYDGSNGVATLSIIGSDFHNDEFIYITDLESDSVYYLEKYKNGIFCDKDFDNIVFTDRSKAYARLAELKGGME